VSVVLPVTYHSQQDPDWCDPADLQMWMQADGVALPTGDDHAIQQQLWDFELSHNDGYTVAQWDASPYAVAVTLDHFAGRQDIGSAPQPTLEAAGIQISRSLAVDHEPVIVMVGGGAHYVLVTGAALGPDGTEAPPAEVTIYDPLAYGVAGSSPHPTSGDIVTWEEFAATYTANTHHAGTWAGQWVLIAAGIPLEG
jgi:hypothetical protein